MWNFKQIYGISTSDLLDNIFNHSNCMSVVVDHPVIKCTRILIAYY